MTLESSLSLPCLLDQESTIREWMTDPRGKVVFGDFYIQIEAMSRKVFGGGSERYGDDNALGMGIMDMLGDMPLLGALGFLQSALPTPAEDVVDELLKKVHSQDE